MTSYERNAEERTIVPLSLTKFASVVLWLGTFGVAFVLLIAVLMTIGPPALSDGAFPLP